MIIDTKKNHKSTEESDFKDFLKVLEDLEQNADHVAIGRVVFVFYGFC